MGTLKILPLLILVAMLSFVVRLGDIVTQVRTPQQVLSASAIAEEPAHGGEAKDGEGAEPGTSVPTGLPEDEPAPLPSQKWADPETLDMQFTETQTRVLEELKERRASLDARESRASQREALLQVTEQRIEEKIAELDAIRNEIKELLGQQSEEEEARIRSLVKIYEGMKPKDAAAIFDNLDMDILIQVVGRMSERKTAPIMATMNIAKAQELTMLLAEQKKLPEMPQ